MVKRPFEQWLFEQVEMEFGIEREKNIPLIVKWLEVSKNVKELSPYFEKLRNSIESYVEIWNESDLNTFFIAPFLLEFEFNNLPHYRVFTQRLMKLQTETVEAAGKVEWMVSVGKQTPRKPFFFLQEYKPEKSSGNDPLGQLLIAMVDAQVLNETNEKPIYGCYTIGRFWFFVILLDKKYSVSKAYDSTQKGDLAEMIEIIKKVKNHIQQELNLPING